MSALRARTAAPWKRQCGWLVPGTDTGVSGANCTWLEYMVARCSFLDIGILETPLGSNKGVRINWWAAFGDGQPGDWWCAHYAGAVFRFCGAMVPDWYAATSNWVEHTVATPRPGSAILYGPGASKRPEKPASHIEIVVEINREGLYTNGGNRAFGGVASNNGVAVDFGPVIRRDILGYIRPTPVPGWKIENFAPLWFLEEHADALPLATQRVIADRLRARADTLTSKVA